MRGLSLYSLLLLTAFSAAGAENMSFHGTLVAPPCKVNNGQTLEVSFGDSLGVNKIDGVNYQTPVNYQITCDAGYTATHLVLVIDTASPTTFDTAAIKTSKNGLGLHILVDGQPASFGQAVEIATPADPPHVEAVPVKDPSASLTEGAFDATMTLRMDYR